LAEDANVDLDRPLPIDPTQFNQYCQVHSADPRCPGGGFNKNIVGNLSANLFYRVLSNALFSASGTYDVRDTRFLGFRVATKLLSTCECWSVTFGLSHSINPSKTTFDFNFNLLGLAAQRNTL
jgi:hypothetical protein